MAKSIKTSKQFQQPDIFEQEIQEVKKAKAKDAEAVNGKQINAKKVTMKKVGTPKSKVKKPKVKIPKKKLKPVKTKGKSIAKRVLSDNEKRVLKNVNDKMRYELETKLGISKTVSAELRKGWRDAFRNEKGEIRLGKLKEETIYKRAIEYVKARGLTSSGITYKEFMDLIRDNITTDTRDVNRSKIWYEFEQYFGDVIYDADKWENETVPAAEMSEFINKVKDYREGKNKDTKSYRKAMRINLDMHLKNREDDVPDVIKLELDKIEKITAPNYVSKATRKKKKKRK